MLENVTEVASNKSSENLDHVSNETMITGSLIVGTDNSSYSPIVITEIVPINSTLQFPFEITATNDIMESLD